MFKNLLHNSLRFSTFAVNHTAVSVHLYNESPNRNNYFVIISIIKNNVILIIILRKILHMVVANMFLWHVKVCSTNNPRNVFNACKFKKSKIRYYILNACTITVGGVKVFYSRFAVGFSVYCESIRFSLFTMICRLRPLRWKHAEFGSNTLFAGNWNWREIERVIDFVKCLIHVFSELKDVLTQSRTRFIHWAFVRNFLDKTDIF